MVTTAATEDLLLPPGTRLLHIGPSKTGTTSVQSAFHVNREALAAHGVHYAGEQEHSLYAVRLGTGMPWHVEREFLPHRHPWRLLVKEIRDAGDARVVISSEAFADTPEPQIRRVVDELGGDRVHVVVTLRALGRIVPSVWQQYVKAGIIYSFDDWLHAQLEDPKTAITPSFRYLHRHDDLIRRWLAVVGADRMTVVAVDDADHGMVLRTFERFVGLPSGLLVARSDRMNRSFTYPEIEVVRAFNRMYKAAAGQELYHRGLRLGAFRTIAVREPPPDEPRIQLPAWAAGPIATRQDEIVAAIASSGVRVLGALERLAQPPPSAPPDAPPVDPRATPELAASFMAGMLYGTGLLPDDGRGGLPGEVAGPEVWGVPAVRLIRALGIRAAKRALRVTRKLPKRVRGSVTSAVRRG